MNTRQALSIEPTGYCINVLGHEIPVYFRLSGRMFLLELFPLAAALGVFADDLEAALGVNGMVAEELVNAAMLKYVIPKLVAAHPHLDGAALMQVAIGLRHRWDAALGTLFHKSFDAAAKLDPVFQASFELLYSTTEAERRLLLAKPNTLYIDIETAAASIHAQWMKSPKVQRWLMNSFRDQPDPLPALPTPKNTWSQ